MAPERVTALDAPLSPQPLPERRSFAQAPGSQFQPDQGREGLLGRTTGGATAAQSLAQGVVRAQAAFDCGVYN